MKFILLIVAAVLVMMTTGSKQVKDKKDPFKQRKEKSTKLFGMNIVVVISSNEEFNFEPGHTKAVHHQDQPVSSYREKQPWFAWRTNHNDCFIFSKLNVQSTAYYLGVKEGTITMLNGTAPNYYEDYRKDPRLFCRDDYKKKTSKTRFLHKVTKKYIGMEGKSHSRMAKLVSKGSAIGLRMDRVNLQ